jgi:hypothetical protein
MSLVRLSRAFCCPNNCVSRTRKRPSPCFLYCQQSSIRGIFADAKTGMPLQACAFALGPSEAGRWPPSRPPLAAFNREKLFPLAAGLPFLTCRSGADFTNVKYRRSFDVSLKGVRNSWLYCTTAWVNQSHPTHLLSQLPVHQQAPQCRHVVMRCFRHPAL